MLRPLFACGGMGMKALSLDLRERLLRPAMLAKARARK